MQRGMRPILYCKRELNDEKTDEYLRSYENLKKNLVQDHKKLEALYDEIETDLNVICVVGLAEKLREGSSDMVKDMRLAGLYPWMATGDVGINALTCAYATNVIDSDTPLLHLEGKNYDAIKLLIRD